MSELASLLPISNLFHSAVGRAPGTIIITRPRGAGRMEKVKEIGSEPQVSDGKIL